MRGRCGGRRCSTAEAPVWVTQVILSSWSLGPVVAVFVDVIVIAPVIVVAPVIVAALVNGNDNVDVIDTVDHRGRSACS